MKAFLFDMDGVIVDTEDIHREAEKKILAPANKLLCIRKINSKETTFSKQKTWFHTG